MIVHELKIKPQYLKSISLREKTFEIRLNDRNYQKSDILNLKGFSEGVYTGEGAVVEVIYIHKGLGLLENYVAMSIECIDQSILFK